LLLLLPFVLLLLLLLLPFVLLLLLLLLPFVLLLLQFLLLAALLLLLASPSNPSKPTGQPEGLEQVSALQSHKGDCVCSIALLQLQRVLTSPSFLHLCSRITGHSSQVLHSLRIPLKFTQFTHKQRKNPRPPCFPSSAYDLFPYIRCQPLATAPGWPL
jgi:hypothetical protein